MPTLHSLPHSTSFHLSRLTESMAGHLLLFPLTDKEWEVKSRTVACCSPELDK